MEPDFGAFFKAAYTDVILKRMIAAVGCVLLAALWGRVKKFFPRPNVLVLLAGIFLAGLVLRTGWVVISPTVFSKNHEDKTTDQSESSLIQIYSAQIAKGGVPLNPNGSLALRRPVGYLYILGFIYKLFGDHQILFKILQIIMGSLLILLAYLLGFQIFKDKGTALLAAALIAFYPLNIISVNILLDEFPFFLFSFAAFYLVAKNIQERTFKHGIAIGILLGLAAASRTHAFLFPVLFFAAYMICRRPFKKAFFQMILSFLLILLVNAPWAMVTWKHYGRPRFFTSLQTGFFYCALNDKASWHNGYYLKNKEEGGDPAVYAEPNPVKAADRANILSIEWVIKHPAKLIELGVRRNLVLFGFQLDDSIVDLNQSQAASKDSFAVRHVHPLRKICSWAYGTLALLALGGIFVLIINRRQFFLKYYPAFTLVLLLFAYWVFIHSLIFGFRKYRWFADLLMVFPASYLLVWISSIGNRPVSNEKSELHALSK